MCVFRMDHVTGPGSDRIGKRGVLTLSAKSAVRRQHSLTLTAVTSTYLCVFPGGGAGMFLWPRSPLYLGNRDPCCRTKLHHDRDLFWTVRHGGRDGCCFWLLCMGTLSLQQFHSLQDCGCPCAVGRPTDFKGRYVNEALRVSTLLWSPRLQLFAWPS